MAPELKKKADPVGPTPFSVSDQLTPNRRLISFGCVAETLVPLVDANAFAAMATVRVVVPSDQTAADPTVVFVDVISLTTIGASHRLAFPAGALPPQTQLNHRSD